MFWTNEFQNIKKYANISFKDFEVKIMDGVDYSK